MKIKILMTLIAGLLLIGAGSAQAYDINGNLSDWGVNPGTTWTPNSGIYYKVEDHVGPGGYVGPGVGGQPFDAEGLYIDWDSDNLYLALVTGFPNTNGVLACNGRYYSAGDIAIDFGNNGTYDYGIEIGSHAGNYGGLNGTAGDVYRTVNNTNWAGGTDFPGTFPAYMLSGTSVGSGAFAYVNTYGEHWVVEMSIPRDIFVGWDGYMTIAWTQSCGNDQITKTVVPEPVSGLLFGIGAIGALLRFRKRKQA